MAKGEKLEFLPIYGEQEHSRQKQLRVCEKQQEVTATGAKAQRPGERVWQASEVNLNFILSVVKPLGAEEGSWHSLLQV